MLKKIIATLLVSAFGLQLCAAAPADASVGTQVDISEKSILATADDIGANCIILCTEWKYDPALGRFRCYKFECK